MLYVQTPDINKDKADKNKEKKGVIVWHELQV